MPNENNNQDKYLSLPRIKVLGRDISKPAMLCLLLLLLPFAPELLLLVDLAGIEVAFTCFLIMIKPFRTWLSIKKHIAHQQWEILKMSLKTERFHLFIQAILITFIVYEYQTYL